MKPGSPITHAQDPEVLGRGEPGVSPCGDVVEFRFNVQPLPAAVFSAGGTL